MATAAQWLGKLAHLKVDKARGDPAPHKPLLLLVVLELAEQGQAFGDILALTPELAFRFCTYWSNCRPSPWTGAGWCRIRMSSCAGVDR